jgi:hypothetical protein
MSQKLVHQPKRAGTAMTSGWLAAWGDFAALGDFRLERFLI